MFSEDAVQYKPFGNPTNLLNVSTTALQHPEKVRMVLEFFYDDKNISEMYEAGLYIPVRKEAVEMATKEPEMKGWSDFAGFDEIFTMPPVPDTLIKLEGPTVKSSPTSGQTRLRTTWTQSWLTATRDTTMHWHRPIRTLLLCTSCPKALPLLPASNS